MRSELDNVITSAGTRVQGAVLTAIDCLVILSVELALKSATSFTGRSVDSDVLEPDQRDFSDKFEGLGLTTSSRVNSQTDLKRIDETRVNITVEEGDLLNTKENIDRQKYAHYRSKASFLLGKTVKNICIEIYWFHPF